MRLNAIGLLSILSVAACARDQKPAPKDERSALQRLRDEYCDFAGQAVCARKDRCPEEVRWWWREAPDCVATVREYCLALPFVDDGNYTSARGEAWAQYLRFDGAKRDACLAQAREAACGEFDGNCIDDDTPIVGTSGRGGGCYYGDHCANEDDYCADNPAVCGGTCQAPAAAGEPCPGSTACAKGTYCTGDEICSAPPGANEPCPDYRCAEASTCFDGTCLAEAQENETCSYVDGPYCRRGLSCETSDFSSPGTCRPPPEPAGEGASCGARVYCRRGLACHEGRCTKVVLHGGACDAATPCERETHCSEGKCVGNPLPGEACQVEGPDCVNNVVCIRDPDATAGACAYPPIPDGKACENDDLCVAKDRTCAPAVVGGETVCRTQGEAGAPCYEWRHCLGAFFCDDTSRTCTARVGAGGDCSADAESCAEGHWCRSSDSTCQPSPGEGEACSPRGTCSGDLWCNGSSCQRPSAPGEPCGETGAGGYLRCAEGLECDRGETCAECSF